jgi:hypothetical protein
MSGMETASTEVFDRRYSEKSSSRSRRLFGNVSVVKSLAATNYLLMQIVCRQVWLVLRVGHARGIDASASVT